VAHVAWFFEELRVGLDGCDLVAANLVSHSKVEEDIEAIDGIGGGGGVGGGRGLVSRGATTVHGRRLPVRLRAFGGDVVGSGSVGVSVCEPLGCTAPTCAMATSVAFSVFQVMVTG